ncbi:MAG: hypothetical protein KatS3mg033_2036 [Thermonema sp.]|uniref:hypothetical protein n=1 Tax=Thermonema sp. TaxID=2231181 RepID=UPI0021DDE5D3|nr:hypothetical protein [Thermonema sp.]GIV40236.1 MAG: hypothetical protein KatS3mg033_2036 [Thermonema sp.]
MAQTYLNSNWQEEYNRIGSIYNYWGALLAVFFSPLVFLREGAEPKDNELLWFCARLVPVLLTACLVVAYKMKRISHECLLLGVSFLLYTSRAYRVNALNITQYALSLSIMFFWGL